MDAVVNHDPNCLFCKIAAGKIPSKKVFENDEIFAFHDINPWAPVHFLMIPKAHIPSMAQLTDEHAGLMGRMMVLVPKLALQEGCNPYPDGGFRVVSNIGAEGRQEIHHLHIHVTGGPRPWLRG
jgi:histidine triad (HIT) family protein